MDQPKEARRLPKGARIALLAAGALVVTILALYGIGAFDGLLKGVQPAAAATPEPSPTPRPTPEVVTAPTGFSGEYTGDSVALSWDPVEGDVAYSLWRNAKAIAQGLTDPYYVDTGYARENVYMLRTLKGERRSEMTTVRVEAGPAAPGNLTASFDVDTRLIRLSWEHGQGAVYNVKMCRPDDGTVVGSAEGIAELSCTMEADYSTAYVITVAAADINGVESLPAEVEITTDPRPIPEYTLTMSIQTFEIGGKRGTVEPGESSYVYKEGTVVNISAHPDKGYFFDHWEITGTGTIADRQSANTTVTMTGDCTVTAVFGHWYYTVHVDVFPWGAGNVRYNGLGGGYTYGEEVELWAVADDGYEFSYWTGVPSGVSDYGSHIRFKMPDRDLYITAVFREKFDFSWSPSW